jgi:hypothetical protein
MTNGEHFDKGDRVIIRAGLFSGTDEVVVHAIHLPGLDKPWRLTVQARSFDGSKIWVTLSGSDVESATKS